MAQQTEYDTIIVGSGFGGSMVAHVLVNAGQKVLMLERGDWVKRGPHNWEPDGTVELTPYYTTETPYRVLTKGHKDFEEADYFSVVSAILFSRQDYSIMGGYHCVGGPSVFYGGVAMRLREGDFEPDPEVVEDARAEWPYRYADLEPYYDRAELILNVAGESGQDPTEPPRRNGYPQRLNGLSKNARILVEAATALDLRPFRLPLAINYASNNGQPTCVECTTCDTFACSIQAKNDLATRVIPNLLRKGMELKTNTVVTRLVVENKRIAAVDCFDKTTGQRVQYRAKRFVLSAGAIASPHLILASGLQEYNPGGHTIGRYLTRHCNAITFGIFPQVTNREAEFNKQVGVHDFYFGHPSVSQPKGKLGGIQQLQAPPAGLIRKYMPAFPGNLIIKYILPRMIGLLVIAEDQPRPENHLWLDPSQKDRFGLPQLVIRHKHSKRDYAARAALVRQAKKILARAGAKLYYVHYINTFSHAVGTVRMGTDPENSALDAYCRFRGLDNFFVVDGSFMPRSSGVNPSLTISANALRVGEHILEND